MPKKRLGSVVSLGGLIRKTSLTFDGYALMLAAEIVCPRNVI